MLELRLSEPVSRPPTPEMRRSYPTACQPVRSVDQERCLGGHRTGHKRPQNVEKPRLDLTGNARAPRCPSARHCLTPPATSLSRRRAVQEGKVWIGVLP